MDFESAARLGALLARDHARAMFELLVTYRDISASEAASRLGLHIQTAQDFLETLADLGIAKRREVREGRRPYFRYELTTERLTLDVDLAEVRQERSDDALVRRIRERSRSEARFVTARGDSTISSVTIWSGDGRERRERRISLTGPQGRFLFHLPFPDADALSIAEIMRQAGIDEALAPEILDIVQVLVEHEVVEVR